MKTGGASSAQYTAELVTTETSLPFPPNLLTMGSAYVFTITAIASPIDMSSAPFRGSATYASADVLTSMAAP